MKVTVCIPTIRPDTIADAIGSIRRQSYTDWELIVVAQGEEQALRERVESAAGGDARVRFMYLDRTGLSIARNAGLGIAIGDVVAFTDDDCEARDDWLAHIVEIFDRNREFGFLVGSLIAPEPTPRRRFKVCPNWVAPELTYDPVASDRTAPEGWGVVGANMSARAEVLAALGGFDEHLGAGAEFAAAEDTDFVMRAESLGITMHASPDVVVHHTHGYRHGIRAVYRHRRNYARGNGALAAKLSLLGDERGAAWRKGEIHAATVSPLRAFRPHRLPVLLLRLTYFLAAYRSCRRNFTVDAGASPVSAVLRPRSPG